jgi:site-specific recombinase XerD
MTGLRFLFRVTLRRLDLAEEVYHIREPQRLPLVMSVDEIKRLMAVASSLKTRVLLSLGYGCGLRASEIVRRGTNYANKVLDVLASQSRDVSMAVMLQQLVEFSACIGGQATEP